jgi:hypothetical protein
MTNVCGNCHQPHQRRGALRCEACLARARRHTRANWAVVHYATHDDEGQVVSVDDQAVVLRFPGNADDTYTYWRSGPLWHSDPPAPHIKPLYVEITFGEGTA